MSLLDDARPIVIAGPPKTWNIFASRYECAICGGWLTPDENHQDACPWLSMPKIVAALEAAELLLEKTGPWPYAIPARILCRICHFEGEGWTHTNWCAWRALREALDA